MEAILKNKNVTFDSVGISDIKHGKIDPRVIAAVTKIAEDHKITITCTSSDHPKFTTGGSISNHALGRGLDIGTVDGEIVRPNSGAARELATALGQLPEEYRPDEIGSPWPISGPGYFTDAGHQDHLHVGFKTEISKDWRPPRRRRRRRLRGAAAPAAVASAVPGAPAVAAAPGAPVAPPPARRRRCRRRATPVSSWLAVAEAASAKKGGSGVFLAVQQPVGPASAIAPAAGVPGMVDAAAAAAPGAGGSSSARPR